VLISAVTPQCLLFLPAGGVGRRPPWRGRVHPTRRTPVNAIFTFVTIASLIIAVWALIHIFRGSTGNDGMSPVTFFVESSTLGTILLLVVYFLSNLALPFYFYKNRRAEFSVLKHGILPVIGMAFIVVPVYYLCKPGQNSPYDWFPYAALGIVVVAVIYAFILNRLRPGLGERVGSILADE
jgi:amino acid transporter